jgi:RND family efflux transporter MFP subunit
MDTSFFRNLAKPPIIIGAVAVIALAAIGAAIFYTTPKTQALYVNPTVGPIVQEVDTTGTVEAADSIDLSFQIGGQIASVSEPVGSHVAAGDMLARLSAADLAAALEQAQAALAVQQATLAGLQAGARPEDIAVSQTAVAGAQSGLLQAKESMLEAARDAYVKSDDAIHNKVDQFFNNPRSTSPTLVFSLNDAGLQGEIVSGRGSMETLLSGWQVFVAAFPDASDADTASIVSQTHANLAQVSAYLDEVASGLTDVIPTTTYPLPTIQGYQANIATARANISAAISALDAANTAEQSAESVLASAQSQLALKQAPAQATDLEAQQAQVASAQADVDAAQAQLAKTVIRAPIAGTITRNDAHLGETAVPGAVLISMNSDAQFQFEMYVSEADLAKVQVGQTGRVELDAYETQAPISAHVIAIDPAATVTGGISSYKVTLQFDQNNPRIQAGLTGSVKIITQSKQSALSVPTSAIITRGTDYFVLRKAPQGDQEVAVQTGIAADDGYTEILSGLTADDQVRTFGTQ